MAPRCTFQRLTETERVCQASMFRTRGTGDYQRPEYRLSPCSLRKSPRYAVLHSWRRFLVGSLVTTQSRRLDENTKEEAAPYRRSDKTCPVSCGEHHSTTKRTLATREDDTFPPIVLATARTRSRTCSYRYSPARSIPSFCESESHRFASGSIAERSRG